MRLGLVLDSLGIDGVLLVVREFTRGAALRFYDFPKIRIFDKLLLTVLAWYWACEWWGTVV